MSQDIVDAMNEHPFFQTLDDEERDDILSLGRIRTAPRGTILFHSGDPHRGFYLVLDGTVQIYRLNEKGRMLVLHVVERGESFAEVPLFDDDAPDTYPATAETLDESRLLFLPKSAFLAFINRHPRLCFGMLKEVSRRLRENVLHLDDLTLHDVKERLGRYLWEASDDHRSVRLSVPKSVLAAELGTVPETLSRALRDLEDEGVILRHRDRIDLTDPASLSGMGAED
ncbi:Crp/Fnr family transcriptional regulator [Longibacter sp.]|uniref:Crp/Fnr family transcriptional regulator n=1 Tax=Longibacter sp. TaxID=2045415 RepID=UPI003EB8810C